MLFKLLTIHGVFCAAVCRICATSHSWLLVAEFHKSLSSEFLCTSPCRTLHIPIFQVALECSINTSFAFTSAEKNVAASQRGVHPPCMSVITEKIPHMYTSVPDRREGGKAAYCSSPHFPRLPVSQAPPPPTHPPAHPAEAHWLVKCRNVCTMPNAVMNLPLRPALSSSLESWWNVNINHVGRSTSETLKGQRGILLFYCFANERHTDGMEIKWKKSQEICLFFCFCWPHPDRRSCSGVPLSPSAFSLRYLVACLTSTVSPNKQRWGIWQGRRSSGSLWREVKRFLYVEILWRGLVKGRRGVRSDSSPGRDRAALFT